MKIVLIGIVCFVLGWLAVQTGVIPAEFATQAGMAAGAPAGLLFGLWLAKETDSFWVSAAVVVFGFAFIIVFPVAVGWMTWSDWAGLIP